MGQDGSEAAAALLGMAGFEVLVADEAPDGQVWLLVQSTGPAPSCSSCGRRAESKGRKDVLVRDLPCGGRPVVLVWRKRRWACVERACPVRTWTEQSELVLPRAVLTERAKDEIFRQLGAHVRPTIKIAREFGVHWGTAWAAFASRANPLIDDPDRIEGVEALGLDETGFLKATAQHPKLWATGLVDVRRGILVDVIEGRDAQVVRGWLNCQTLYWCTQVKVVSIDPFEAYRSGLKPRLAHAVVVADPVSHRPAGEHRPRPGPSAHPERADRPPGTAGRPALRHPPGVAHRV